MSAGQTVSRRTVAKGAAWSVPVVTVGAMAPALAVSQVPYYGQVCRIHYDDATANAQTTWIFFGWCTQNGLPGTIPVGATFTYTITSPTAIPAPAPAPTSSWYTQTNTLSADQRTLTVTIRLTQAQTLSGTGCYCGAGSSTQVNWSSGTQNLAPLTELTITNRTNGVATGSLGLRLPRRYSGSGTTVAARYLSRTGAQCYPETRFTYLAHSTSSYPCGDGQSDTSVIYPDGTCRKVDLTSGQQLSIPKVC